MKRYLLALAKTIGLFVSVTVGAWLFVLWVELIKGLPSPWWFFLSPLFLLMLAAVWLVWLVFWSFMDDSQSK